MTEHLNDIWEKVDDVAINIHKVWKEFGFKKTACPVLQGLNLVVPKATIYGLLGPSGCGKTTLLKCLLGEAKIDAGSITVMGLPPGGFLWEKATPSAKPDVGYMPQDIALNVNLTMKETFRLFGAICGMTLKQTKERTEFLLTFLGITVRDKLIGQLSGGQQRRISFAIALLHEPQLLILDEPTVGVDPILRRNIWNYLNKLVNAIHRPTTIIITTHYIEEARMANNVGMMLNGKLLEEGCPSDMIRRYSCVTLEQVFLKLCLDKNSEKCQPNDEKRDRNIIEKNEIKTQVCKAKVELISKVPRWHRIQALSLKNILFLFRHYGALIFEIILPPLVITIFTFTIGTPLYGLPVGVINDDHLDLGKLYLDHIDERSVIQYAYNNHEDALAAAACGKIKGIVRLNSNFTDGMRMRMKEGALTDNTSILNSQVSVALDLTIPSVAYAINGELLFAFRRFSQHLLSTMELNPLAGDAPIKLEKLQVYGSPKTTAFNQFLFPGIIICVAFFITMTVTAIALVLERKTGTLERFTISGVLPVELIFSHMSAQAFVMTIQVLLELIVSFAVLGFSCEGSYVWVVLLLFLQGICGMNLGIVLSASFSSETVILMMCVGLWKFFLFSQGYLWPVESMTTVLRFATRLLPQALALEAMRSIINRGWDITYPEVYMAFIVTFAWAVIFLLTALRVSRRKL